MFDPPAIHDFSMTLKMSSHKDDGFVKNPSAALRCILRRCGVPCKYAHSSGLAHLASGAFYFAIQILTFYESIRIRI
jgi:hypothetical protein